MEDSVKIDINIDETIKNDEENITFLSPTDNKEEMGNKTESEVLFKDEKHISIILEKPVENENSKIELSPHTPISTTDEVFETPTCEEPDPNKGFFLTTSCSVDSFNKLMKANSDSHPSINNLKNQEENQFDSNLSTNVNKNNKLRPSSLVCFDSKDSQMNRSNQDSFDQVMPLKTKRPSLSFIKHITVFSDTYKKTKKNNNNANIKEESKTDTISGKKSASIKKVIIRSDSNIIGHFDNVVVKEKKSKTLENANNISDEALEINNKKISKLFENDNPAHTASFSDTANVHVHILSSSFVGEQEMSSVLSRPYSKSMPVTMNYISSVDNNIDIIDQKYESKQQIDEANINIDTSNGNINYNDFLFSDDEVNDSTDQNITHDPLKEIELKEKKKNKVNMKNVTFNESECDYIPNIYELHITEETELYCTKCKKKVNIEVRREYSKTFWILFIILLLCGVIFAWIPFLFNRFKYYSFYCSNCKKRILKLQQASEE